MTSYRQRRLPGDRTTPSSSSPRRWPTATSATRSASTPTSPTPPTATPTRSRWAAATPRTPFQRFTLKAAPLTYVCRADAPAASSSSLRRLCRRRALARGRNLLDLGPADHGFLTPPTPSQDQRHVRRRAQRRAAPARGRERALGLPQRHRQAGQRARAGRSASSSRGTAGLQRRHQPAARRPAAPTPRPGEHALEHAAGGAALDRLVAPRDYADFTRLLRRHRKASAARLASRHGRLVHVTVAGVDDIPIDPTSRPLAQPAGGAASTSATRSCRAPGAPRTAGAGHRGAGGSDADHSGNRVEPQLRGRCAPLRLRTAATWPRPAYAAEAIAAMQAVPGVDYVDARPLHRRAGDRRRRACWPTLGTDAHRRARRVGAVRAALIRARAAQPGPAGRDLTRAIRPR